MEAVHEAGVGGEPANRRLLVGGAVALAVFTGASLLAGPLFFLLWPWTPVVAVVALAAAVVLTRWLLAWSGHVWAYRAGLLGAFLCMVGLSGVGGFMEGFIDDGPFYARAFDGDLSALTPAARLPFRAGELLVYNRDGDAAPVLVHVVDGRTRWALELRGSERDRSKLYSMERPVVRYQGRLRARVDFVGKCTFGTERGRVYLPRVGIARFYMSW